MTGTCETGVGFSHGRKGPRKDTRRKEESPKDGGKLPDESLVEGLRFQSSLRPFETPETE